MNIGQIVTTRTLKDRLDDEKGRLLRELSWKATPPGSMYVVMVLGYVKKGEQFDRAKYDAALKDLGLMEIPSEHGANAE